MRYCFFFYQLKVQCFRIISTSHSGVSSMISGGGSRKFRPYSGVSLYRVKRKAWKMLWSFHVLERLRRYAMWEILAATLKGLYHLGDSFWVPSIHFRFVSFSHTLSPIWNSLYFWGCCSWHSYDFQRASKAAVLDSLIFLRCCCKPGIELFWVGW